MHIVVAQLNARRFLNLRQQNHPERDFGLGIQKQSGLNDVPYTLHIINKNGIKKDYNVTLNSDFVLSESK